MGFRTQFDKRDRYYCSPGSPIRDIMAGEYNKEKVLEVVKKGEEDFYAYINSFADSVDINVLLKRFANGDKEALLQRAGAYIDISALPTNINDFIALSRNAENLFNTLPVEVKQQFNNNVVEFISKVGDDDWLQIMNQSPAEIKDNIITKSNEATKANKEAAKAQFGSTVYGEEYNPAAEVVETVTKSKKINPITGNEVNG